MRELKTLKDTDTGEIVAVCELSQTRLNALIKAYKLAGLHIEVA